MTSPRGHETGVAPPSQCRSSSGHGGHLHGGRRDGGRWPGLHQPLDHARTLSRQHVRPEEKLAQSKIFFVVLMWISIRVGDQLNIRTPGSLASARWITDYSVTLISYFQKYFDAHSNIAFGDWSIELMVREEMIFMTLRVYKRLDWMDGQVKRWINDEIPNSMPPAFPQPCWKSKVGSELNFVQSIYHSICRTKSIFIRSAGWYPQRSQSDYSKLSF